MMFLDLDFDFVMLLVVDLLKILNLKRSILMKMLRIYYLQIFSVDELNDGIAYVIMFEYEEVKFLSFQMLDIEIMN